MANTKLFASGVLCAIIHLQILGHNWYYDLLLINGCTSTLLNHGLTNYYVKWYDRIAMIISAIIDLQLCLILRSTAGFAWINMSIMLFTFAKMMKLVWPHMLSHITLAIAHVYISHTLPSA